MAHEWRLVCVPPDDEAFVAAVRAAFATFGGPIRDDELVAAVKAILQVRYPDVRLRSRDAIADYLPDEVTWYVYRDGGPGEHSDRDAVRVPGR